MLSGKKRIVPSAPRDLIGPQVTAEPTGNSIRKPRHRRRRRGLASLLIAVVATSNVIPTTGCGLLSQIPDGPHDTTASYHASEALQIEYPEVARAETAPTQAAQQASEPLSLEDPADLPSIEITLDEAIRQAVQESPVLRTIGGAIVTSPQIPTATIYDPAMAHANPATGVEAALSAFDAQYNQSLFWSRQDSPRNLAPPPADFEGFFVDTNSFGRADFSGELTKTTATGAQFSLRHIIGYDKDKPPFVQSRRFRSAFEGSIQAEYRQPLGQGAGTTFNRIAGPSTVPGQYNGVLIARINEDVALAEFETAVIGLVADVEQAYWDLWTAYRVLEAVAKGRESALQTFQYQQVRLEVGTGRLDEEAQARSQYYEFETQLQNALGGQEGLYAREQRLRYLIGMPATDGTLIRPSTDPVDTRVVFDWQSALSQALSRRVEIRQQRFNVKRREMELVAARLNRRPRVDLVNSYSWVGLGDDLIGSNGDGRFDNLYGSITGGDFQEWRTGVEMSFPVGLRAAGAAIAHARLSLNRERALLAETELRISHDLSDSARRIALTHELLETNYNRYVADLRQADVLRRRYLDGADNINFLLQAQRQVVVSEADFYRSLSDYNLALRDFHQQKGSLLAYSQVQLAEGPWAAGATRDAYETGRFLTPRVSPEKVSAPQPLTSGPFDPSDVQETAGPSLAPGELLPESDRIPDDETSPAENVLPDPSAASRPPERQQMIIEDTGAAFDTPKLEGPGGIVHEAPAGNEADATK